MAVVKKYDNDGAYYQLEGDWKMFHLETYGRGRARALALSRAPWLEGMPMFDKPWDESSCILSSENEKEMAKLMPDETLTYNKDGYFIELNQLDGVSGRARIKMSAHAIYPNRNMWNGNGISWGEEETLANIDSAIGMAYVVNFIDKERQEMPYDHGTMVFDEFGSVSFPDSDEVGSVQKAYIEDLNGVKTLMTEGYINAQRYPLFVKWLKKAIEDGEIIHGSVEINGKNGSKIIEYVDGGARDSNGDLITGRRPKVFDYTGLAILYFEEPADKLSQVVEVNAKTKKNQDGKKEDGTMTIEEKYQAELEKNAKLKVDKDTLTVEINSLKDEAVALGKKIEEKDELVLNAAKTLKETETELNSLKESNVEINEKLETIEKAKAEAEINTFVEGSADYLDEASMTILKDMTETCSLADIKVKRAELIESKFIADAKAKAETETNSKTKEDVTVNSVNKEAKVEIDSKATSLADIQ